MFVFDIFWLVSFLSLLFFLLSLTSALLSLSGGAWHHDLEQQAVWVAPHVCQVQGGQPHLPPPSLVLAVLLGELPSTEIPQGRPTVVDVHVTVAQPHHSGFPGVSQTSPLLNRLSTSSLCLAANPWQLFSCTCETTQHLALWRHWTSQNASEWFMIMRKNVVCKDSKGFAGLSSFMIATTAVR